MKVILAGMPKTGTKTMCAAFRLLGYKTYDWLEHFWYLDGDWVRIMREGASPGDFKKMYQDVDAITAGPIKHYWEEILEDFPEAKVILTMRDEDSWCKSRRSQFESYNNDILFRMMLCLTYSGWKFSTFMYYQFRLLGNQRANWPWSNFITYKDETIRRIYRKHNKYLIQNCPKTNLLVYDVKQGWEPLCKFLGVEPPPVDFPKKNKGASLLVEFRKENKIMQRMQKELYISFLLLFGLAAFALFKFVDADYVNMGYGIFNTNSSFVSQF